MENYKVAVYLRLIYEKSLKHFRFSAQSLSILIFAWHHAKFQDLLKLIPWVAWQNITVERFHNREPKTLWQWKIIFLYVNLQISTQISVIVVLAMYLVSSFKDISAEMRILNIATIWGSNGKLSFKAQMTIFNISSSVTV